MILRDKMESVEDFEQTHLEVIIRSHPEAVANMDAAQLECHIQMLIEVVFHDKHEVFVTEIEEAVGVVISRCYNLV